MIVACCSSLTCAVLLMCCSLLLDVCWLLVDWLLAVTMVGWLFMLLFLALVRAILQVGASVVGSGIVVVAAVFGVEVVDACCYCWCVVVAVLVVRCLVFGCVFVVVGVWCVCVCWLLVVVCWLLLVVRCSLSGVCCMLYVVWCVCVFVVYRGLVVNACCCWFCCARVCVCAGCGLSVVVCCVLATARCLVLVVC